MKVKCVKKFRDKETKKIIQVGTELEIEEERFNEIRSVGDFVEKVEEIDPDTSEDAGTADTESDESASTTKKKTTKK